MVDTVVVNTTPAEPSLEETAKSMGINPETVDPTAIQQTAPERPGWLPEKFKSPEDMANAYAELEKKLSTGEKSAEPKEAPATEETPKEETPKTDEEQAREAVDKAGLNFDELSAKYWERGSLEDSDYEDLEKSGIPRHLVDQHIEGQKALLQLERQEALSIVGGEEAYTNMVKWAAEAFTEKEIESYDKAVNGNDKVARHMAIKGLQARFKAENGFEPKRTASGTGRASADVYESIAEVQADMSDPRYSKDPAFIKRVEAKLARSNIF